MPCRITGFTVIRHAVLMGYPVVEAIRSILPVVDDYIVAVGAGDDATRALIESIDDPKVRIVDTIWDLSANRGGRVLADKTNEALAMCTGDWCFYLQADEVVHERDLPAIREACERHLHDARVEALLFRYQHFYGSFDVVATARNWYRREVRIVRNRIGMRSIGDAQSFRAGDRKPRVMSSGATINHYGWVKSPERMERKQSLFSRWYDGPDAGLHPDPTWQFRQLYGLQRYQGDHPAVMRALIEQQDWQFRPRFAPRDWKARDWKNAISAVLEAASGYRVGERKEYVLLP